MVGSVETIDEISQYMEGTSDGISVQLTTQPQKYIAGIYTFSLKQSSVERQTNVRCPYRSKKMVPFASRREGDGRKWETMSAFRERDGKWSLITTPVQHEQWGGFESISPNDMMVVKPGDFLSASCGQAVVSTEGDDCRIHLMYYMNNGIVATQLLTTCDSLVQNSHIQQQQEQKQQETQPERSIQQPVSATSSPVGPKTTQASERKRTVVIHEGTTTAITKLAAMQPDSPTAKTSEVTEKKFSTTPSPSEDDRVVVEPSSAGPRPSHLIENWWKESNGSLGTISSIDINGNTLYVLQRGHRNVSSKSFDDEHYYREHNKPILHATITLVDTNTGRAIRTSGGGLLYLPYSLTVDASGNVWVADIALHQVVKFTKTLRTSLILGTKSIPGTDVKHFCKPCDVAVDAKVSFLSQ